MRLFSTPEIIQQAQAEQDFKPLARWIDVLYAQTQWNWKHDKLPDHLVWKDWIRLESIRRTIVFADLLNSVYTYLKFNWYQPSARASVIGFTGQVELWEARSAADWHRAKQRKPHFGVNVSTFQNDIQGASPGDLDELGILFRAAYDGIEVLTQWFDGDTELLERWGLKTQGTDPSSFFLGSQQ